MSEQHAVYLAVPGVNFCWGTVLGVVRSTAKHVARPFNGGCGFSGTEDFNIMWADAHNLYDKGEITHFAMLHGDITPDPSQHWLDELLDVMDERGASMVSAVSPIKDSRGVTSSGIADLDDPWRPYRRFTVREILQDLPETFDNVAAGYPDRPLLHNTGMWVCDLRRPVFRASVAGRLELQFEFPTECYRTPGGMWAHRRESEDWAFSKALWLRGIRDTYITRRPRLTHHGKAEFVNSTPWGSYANGDEDTADKWRPAVKPKPLSLVQLLNFELGAECNLGNSHAACPNMREERFASLDTSRTMTDDAIVEAAKAAYMQLGFTGLIGWAYYNEPLLQMDRMFRLMERIRKAVPQSRFILWTNGTLIPGDADLAPFRQFEQIVVSCYGDVGRREADRIHVACGNVRKIDPARLDSRATLVNLDGYEDGQPCLRPFVELAFDCHGNSHLCCYDWQGKATLGNLMDAGIEPIAARWLETLPSIAGQQMSSDAPAVCRTCPHKWSKYQLHDAAIVGRAKAYRETLARATA